MVWEVFELVYGNIVFMRGCQNIGFYYETVVRFYDFYYNFFVRIIGTYDYFIFLMIDQFLFYLQVKTRARKKSMGVLDIYGFEIFEVLK